MAATSSACRSRPIGRSGAAARAARAWPCATRISSRGCSSPTRTRRSCSSPRAASVYKLKVWRLPVAAPNARGKALVNMLPLEQGERITSIMPLPEDEGSWGDLDIMFATTRGTVRRNSLADFTDIRANGKIAMKLEEGDGIVGVETCSASDDVLLTTARRAGDPLFGGGRARVRGPQFGRRARHQSGRGRPCHLHGDPARHSRQRRKNAPPISSAAGPCAAKPRRPAPHRPRRPGPALRVLRAALSGHPP